MNDFIEQYLNDHGPSLSSEVSEHLVKTHKLPPATARKRGSRVKGEVRRLAHIIFPRQARFIYLKRDFMSAAFWNRLVESLLKTKSAYGLAIAAIQQRRGLIPEAHFAIACGAPLKQTNHLPPDTIFQRLEEAGLLKKTDVAGLGPCITPVHAPGFYDDMEAEVRARLIAEKFLLMAIKDWLRKLNMVSYNAVEIREDETRPSVGTFAWDLTAPSYLGGLAKYDGNGSIKPGFVACDVYLGGGMNAIGVQPFIHKCATLRMLRNVGPCLQIFVANDYSEEAFMLLKGKGIIPATPRNLFGEEVAEALIALSQVLREAAERAIDPDKFDQLFNTLGKIEGASSQLRGTLFEFLVEAVVRKKGATHVQRNREFSIDGKQAEADIIGIREHQSITFIECKGANPDSETPTHKLQRWLNHSIPVFYKAIRSHPDWKHLEICFEFWTTGFLSDEAIKSFQAAQKRIKATRYTIELRQTPQIVEMCRSTKDEGLVTAFKKHFTRLYPNGAK